MAKRNQTRNRPLALSASDGHRLRAELGLTQQQLALLLGVSRVMLAKGEGGRQSLPSLASRRQTDLLLTLLRQAAEPPPPLPPPLADQRAELELRLLGIRVAEFPVRERLERLRVRLAQLRRRQQMGAALRAALPPLAEAAMAHRQLDRLLSEADEVLALDAGAPLLLELRLRLLALERAEIEWLLAVPLNV